MSDIETILKQVEQALPAALIGVMQRARVQLVLGSSADAASFQPVVIDPEFDAEPAEDMTSLPTKYTGIVNVIWVSGKGNARHPARIKIAINPSHTFNPVGGGEIASMAVHDFSTRGAYIPPRVRDQCERWIALNRTALISYWNYEIDTGRLFELMQKIE
jgi:hypothetical protein